jgi:predicted phage tail protein
MQNFSGAGGGTTTKQKTPTETKDNLRSKDKIEVLLGLCRGPIHGLVDGHKSVYIGDTKLQNADGTYNFPDAGFTVYPGNNPGETIYPLLGGFEDWRQVGKDLAYNVPHQANTQTVNPSQVILRFQVKKLYQTTDYVVDDYSTRGTIPHRARFNIRYKMVGNDEWIYPYAEPYEILGRTLDGEVHEIRVPNNSGLPGPFTFEVTLLTADTEMAPCQVYWEGFYDVMAGLYGLTRSTTINTRLEPSSAITRTTDTPGERLDGSTGIDMIDLRFTVSSLYIANPQGTFDDEIDLLIEAKPTTSNTWQKPFGGTVKIRGKTTSAVVFEYRFNVQPINVPYDIRVTRISGDLPEHYRDIVWESFQEIVGGPARFDDVAVAHLTARASDQFSSLPDFSAEYYLEKCRVPTNYDPWTRTYTGTWDGAWKVEWTNNPAFCFYQLAMDAVDGAKKFWPDLSINKFDIYDAARWCDELVPNGKGGWQPRYTFNGLITEARGIKDQLRYMAGVFNATFVDDLNGAIRLVIDKDDAATAIFGPENIYEEGFQYSYTDPSTRFNDFTVKFANPDLKYETDTRVLRDSDHQARYGAIPYDFIGIGCTDAHEAMRRAAHKMITATTEVEMVSFTTNRRGLYVRPYDIILVSDPDMGYALSGRIKSLNENRTIVSVRDPLYLEDGVVYTLQVEVPNPTTGSFDLVSVPLVGPYDGYVYDFELSAQLPEGLPAYAYFTLGAVGSLAGTPKPYRVLSMEEVESNPDQVMISAVEVNRNKTILSDSVKDSAVLEYTNMPSEIAPPVGLQVYTTTANVNGKIVASVTLTWTPSPDPRVNRYQVHYRLSGETAWQVGPTVSGTRAEILNIPNGTYDFRVGAVAGVLGVTSSITADGVPAGLMVPPSNVPYLDVGVIGDGIRLTWGAVPDADLAYYWIRYTPLIGPDATWGVAMDLVAQVTGTSVQVPLAAGTYFIKAVDVTGTASRQATGGSTAATPMGLNAVSRVDHHPLWSGEKVGCYVDQGMLKKIPGFEGPPYYVAYTEDLGVDYVCRLSLEMVGSAEIDGYNMINWPRLADMPNLTGAAPGDFEFRVTFNVNRGGIWQGWQNFVPGEYEGRHFAFLISMVSNRDKVMPVLMRVTTVVDMPDRIESNSYAIVPSGGLDVTFSRPFRVTPSIGVTGKNAQTGDYYIISNESPSGFRVQYYNAAGSPVSRTIAWIGAGYGYGVI